MTIEGKHLAISVAVVLFGGILAYFGLPIWAATNHYNTAQARGDYVQMCIARDEGIAAWSATGISSKVEDWNNGRALECLIASQR